MAIRPRRPQRVALVQLAHALNDRNHWFCNKQNVPLAAGYLRAVARSRGLLERVSIDILEPELADHGGDAAIVSALTRRRVDLLGLSLYPWNLTRSLAIAAAVRRHRPTMTVVAGGPEVNANTLPELLDAGAIDFAIQGEGEITFSELLEVLLDGGDPGDVAGLAFRRGDEIVETERRATLRDLDVIPSPYLEGDIDVGRYRQVHILYERGCPYACIYCHWWPDKRSRGRFSLARIERELEHLRAIGVREVIILDAALNTAKGFEGLCDVLERTNGDGHLDVKVQVLFDYLTRAQLERLVRGGVRKLELGLQSASPDVLKRSNRPTDVTRFSEALEMTEGLPLDLQVDFIMGLPGDTPETVAATARAIRATAGGRRVAQVSPFLLSVGSPTRLRTEATAERIRYQPEPPYRVLSVGDLDWSTLRRLRMQIPAELGSPDHACFQFDRPHYGVNLFEPEFATFSSASPDGPAVDLRALGRAGRVDGVVVTCACDDAGHSHALEAGPLADRLAQLVSVWFRSAHPEACVDHIRATLATLSVPNPYAVWDVVIESGGPFDLDVVDRAVDAIAWRPHNLDWDNHFARPDEGPGFARVATRPFVVVPLGAASEAWMQAAALRVPLVHSLTIEPSTPIRETIAEVAALPGEGVVIDVAAGVESLRVPELISHLLGLDRRVRTFRNSALKALFAAEQARRSGAPRPRVPYADRHLMMLGADGVPGEVRLTSRQTLLDVTQLCLELRRTGAAQRALA